MEGGREGLSEKSMAALGKRVFCGGRAVALLALTLLFEVRVLPRHELGLCILQQGVL